MLVLASCASPCPGHMVPSLARLIPLFFFPPVHVIILDSFKIYWKTWTLSSLIWQFQRPFPASHLVPYFHGHILDPVVPVTASSQSVYSSLTTTLGSPVHILSRTPTPKVLWLNWDHSPSTLPLFLLLSSHHYFSYSQCSFHGPSLCLYPCRCPQHSTLLTLSSYIPGKVLILVERLSGPNLWLHQSSWM